MWQDTRSTQKKSVVILYTNDNDTEKEIREASLFTIAADNIKYLGITLTKEVKDLYNKNFEERNRERYQKMEQRKISENGKISYV